jgi:histidine ammonia-lyase
METLRIGDEPLTPAAVAAAARSGRVEVELSEAARERMAAAHRTVEAAAEWRPVYGRTTGVGANRHVEVGPGEARAHSVRLLRSHAGGMGEPLPDDVVRGTILVRLAQMAAGGGAHRPEVADALAAVLGHGPLPVLRNLGGIGTGDLTLLAQLALALAGEGDWGRQGRTTPPPWARLEIERGDALPFMSSNAATFASATLAWSDVRELLDAGLGIAALTFRALDGNREAFAPQIGAARPLAGLIAVSERLRALTDGAAEPAWLQDPFGLRCLPPVAGALHDAAAGLHDVLMVEINAAAENPLIADGEVLHHGGFHAATCALALDGLRLALVPFASLSAARLTHLMAPSLTGLPAFLAVDAPGSSGVLIAEYLAADALARLRADAAPAVLGSVAISRGLEEHASFAWQAAGQARHAVFHLRTVLALEWVVAERALRMKGVPADGPLAPARALAEDFDARLEDRPIGADGERAAAALPALAEVVRSVASPARH